MSFHERKKERKEYYEKYIKGWKLRNCTACNGSGYYDSHNSPPCGACDGTGKERLKPTED
jgi:DnaJ-class molecular chaperone